MTNHEMKIREAAGGHTWLGARDRLLDIMMGEFIVGLTVEGDDAT